MISDNERVLLDEVRVLALVEGVLQACSAHLNLGANDGLVVEDLLPVIKMPQVTGIRVLSHKHTIN